MWGDLACSGYGERRESSASVISSRKLIGGCSNTLPAAWAARRCLRNVSCSGDTSRPREGTRRWISFLFGASCSGDTSTPKEETPANFFFVRREQLGRHVEAGGDGEKRPSRRRLTCGLEDDLKPDPDGVVSVGGEPQHRQVWEALGHQRDRKLQMATAATSPGRRASRDEQLGGWVPQHELVVAGEQRGEGQLVDETRGEPLEGDQGEDGKRILLAQHVLRKQRRQLRPREQLQHVHLPVLTPAGRLSPKLEAGGGARRRGVAEMWPRCRRGAAEM